MMDWLSRPLPDFWAGIGLVVFAVIWFVCGTACVAAGYREGGAPAWPRWLPGWVPRGWLCGLARWAPPNFSWWLGMSLLGGAIIVGYIGFAVLTDDNNWVPLWGMGLCVGTMFCALMAFRLWAIERWA